MRPVIIVLFPVLFQVIFSFYRVLVTPQINPLVLLALMKSYQHTQRLRVMTPSEDLSKNRTCQVKFATFGEDACVMQDWGAEAFHYIKESAPC